MTKLVTIVGCGVLCTVCAHAASGQGSFTQTDDGNWETVLAQPDGSTRLYIYVPGTKFIPTVRVNADVQSAENSRVLYRYDVSNDQRSVQSIAYVMFAAGVRSLPPVDVTYLPTGWQKVGPALYGASGAIAPGGAEVIELTAEALPGVFNIDMMGDVPLMTSFPSDMNQTQRAELENLSRVKTIEVKSIGPAIVFDRAASTGTLVQRVLEHYLVEFTKAKHGQASELAKLLSSLGPDDQSVSASIAAMIRIGSIPQPESWQHDLSVGLTICGPILQTYKPIPP